MEASEDEEIKLFDDTVAFIYNSVSSSLPPDLPKELCEEDSKVWFVKTEPTSLDRDATDKNQNPGLQLECEPSLKMLIKKEVISPAREHVEERSMGLPDLPKELCEVDSKVWFVKTEPTSPDRDATDDDQNPDLSNKQATGSDRNLLSSHYPHASQFQSDLQIHADSLHKKFNAIRYPLCENYSSLQNNLKMHLALAHTKIIAFQCVYCQYRSTSKTYMKKHIGALHKNVKIQCPHCTYKTNWKKTLIKHIDSVHNKIWAFQCTLCEYKSNCKSTLKIHINSVHRNIRPYQCKYCEYKGIWKSTLKSHIDSVHKKKNEFECAHCEYKTNWKSTLKRHIDRVHKKRRKKKKKYSENSY